MLSSRSWTLMLVRSHAAPSQPVLHPFGEKIDVGWVVIQARNLTKGFAAGADKEVLSLATDFLDRFETIGGEGGANHEQPLLAPLREPHEFIVGVGRQPWL